MPVASELVVLLLVGLAISMALVIVGGSVIAGLLDRLRWLAYLGALVIAWTGADLIQQTSSSRRRWITCRRSRIFWSARA